MTAVQGRPFPSETTTAKISSGVFVGINWGLTTTSGSTPLKMKPGSKRSPLMAVICKTYNTV